MKTIIILAIIGYTLAVQGTPAATAYCMGNNEGATTCSACYNYTLGTIGAKQLSASACTAAVANAITDCLWYSGTITSTIGITDCGKCNSKTWMNVSSVSTATRACSATASSTTLCTTAPTNCDQAYCLQTTSSVYAPGCRICASGYYGSGTVTTVGFPTCITAATVISSCNYYNPLLITQCYLCASNFAVSALQTACTSFTTDANCRMLSSGGSWCGQCKNNYYFTTTTCTLGYDATTAAAAGANLMAASAFIMTLLVFFN